MKVYIKAAVIALIVVGVFLLLYKYKTSISYVLKHKVPILLLAVILLLGSIYFSLQKGFKMCIRDRPPLADGSAP